MRSLFISILLAASLARAADPIFSGPQVGETTTPFPVLRLLPPLEGQQQNPVKEHAGAPTTLVFLHGLERSLVPLLSAIDRYGEEKKGKLKTEIIFLSPDRIQGEQRLKAAMGSLRLKSMVGLSPDGLEGPGNYGLNKECLMTILTAKDNKVTANFALLQPGIADAGKVLAAMASLIDEKPPTAEQIRALSQRGMGPEGAMRRDPAAAGRTNAAGSKPVEAFPGAVPTDDQLQGLMRQFIRPTNDNARVDSLIKEIETYIAGSPDLKKQAVDGWTRILHFGDRYGTEYARKVGREALDKWKKSL